MAVPTRSAARVADAAIWQSRSFLYRDAMAASKYAFDASRAQNVARFRCMGAVAEPSLAALLTAQFYSPAEVIMTDFDENRPQVATRHCATATVNAVNDKGETVIR
jgi:hypothetical protein